MKVKINVVDGKAASSGISLGNKRTLIAEGQDYNKWHADQAGIEICTVADVDDSSAWNALVERGVLVKVAGRPRAE